MAAENDQEKEQLIPATKSMRNSMHGYIVCLDPHFGTPVPDYLTKRSAGGPVMYFLLSIEKAKQVLMERGEPSDAQTLANLLTSEYEQERREYAEQTATRSRLEDLPSNPFTERFVAGVLANEKA